MPQFDPLFKKPITAACSNQTLLDRVMAAPLPTLQAAPSEPSLRDWLQQHATSLPDNVAAGLWLLAGDLHQSHELSQSEQDAEADFWHAIMHRREGDFANAKYWFRRVARHPLLHQLASTGYGNPLSFVDRCQQACQQGSPKDIAKLQQLQWLEWQGLWLASWPLDTPQR